MKYFTIILLLISISCKKQSNLNPQQIKIGTFKTTIKDGNFTSFATRNDSIQIETFEQKKDTFYIKWISNFEYTLNHKNPKTELEKRPFIVKITGIKENAYTFMAYYKGSNFKQKGKAIKIN